MGDSGDDKKLKTFNRCGFVLTSISLLPLPLWALIEIVKKYNSSGILEVSVDTQIYFIFMSYGHVCLISPPKQRCTHFSFLIEKYHIKHDVFY